jgi:dimethylargininase
MLLALTRSVPPTISECELTHLQREPIDYARAVAEHAQYEAALTRLGCRVERLPDAPELPDSVFVEDAAVVIDELAVIARPGAASRRPEVDAIAAALRPHRPLAFIEAPGTLDGGDVLVTPGRIFVGISGRTNAEGVRQLAAFVAPHGFATMAVPVTGCLHLKSAVTAVFLPPEGGSHMNGEEKARSHTTGDENGGSHTTTAEGVAWLPPSGGRVLLLINPTWIDRSYFDGFELIDVDPSEPAAANVLSIGESVICAEDHPKTRARLDARGLVTRSVPAGELAKAEGGVTCCSIILPIT